MSTIQHTHNGSGRDKIQSNETNLNQQIYWLIETASTKRRIVTTVCVSWIFRRKTSHKSILIEFEGQNEDFFEKSVF